VVCQPGSSLNLSLPDVPGLLFLIGLPKFVI
jgi:hypothetical protein